MGLNSKREYVSEWIRHNLKTERDMRKFGAVAGAGLSTMYEWKKGNVPDKRVNALYAIINFYERQGNY